MPPKKAKVKATGFYQPPQPVARSTTLSADGRRQIVSHQVFDYKDAAAVDVTIPGATLEDSAADPLQDLSAPPLPEPVEGIEGVSVVAKTRAKRYASSVRPRRFCFAVLANSCGRLG